MGDLAQSSVAEEESLSPQITPPMEIDDDYARLRINSTGKKVSSKEVPHYLRASTGSCHDMCKFGHKNSAEAESNKPRRPTLRRASSKPIESHVAEETIASLAKKKNSPFVAVKLKNSPSLMRRSLDSLNPPCSDERKKMLVSSKSVVVKETNSSEKLPVSQKIVKSLSMSRVALSTKVSQKPTLNRFTSSKRNPNGLKKAVAHLESPNEEIQDPKPTNTKSYEEEKKTVYVVKTKSKENKLDLVDQTETFSCEDEDEKIVFVVKTEPEEYSTLDLDQSEVCFHKDDEKIVFVVETGGEDYTNDSDQSENCDREVKYVIEMENEERVNKLEETGVIERENEGKILEMEETEICAWEIDCVDKTKTEHEIETRDDFVLMSNSSSSSDRPSSSSLLQEEEEEEEEKEESEYTLSESEAETCSESSEAEVTNNNSNKGRQSSGAGDENEKARKLKFRRGTVIELRSEDSNNNAPRRLRFRRGSVLSESGDFGSGDDRRRRIVVLKHQDVQGKRDTQGLFNNVIEETASKLVESRKSKVKALVGAFETVISLQDGKA